MQFQKSSSHTLASRLNRYTVLGTAALSMGLLLYGCGENRVAQCNKLVTVANKTKDLVAPKDVTGFTQLADKIDQIRTEVQAIAVKDSQLLDLQTKLLSMYGDVSAALKAHAKATEAKDTNAQTKAKQDLETAASKENDLVDSINTLCTKQS
jgi:hypothetical protein